MVETLSLTPDEVVNIVNFYRSISDYERLISYERDRKTGKSSERGITAAKFLLQNLQNYEMIPQEVRTILKVDVRSLEAIALKILNENKV